MNDLGQPLGFGYWNTDGRPRTEQIRVHCQECGEWIPVTASIEYGAADWDREDCPACSAPFPDNAEWEQR